MAGKQIVQSRGDGVTILEEGDIFFLYIPKVEHESAESLEDVQRMKIVLHPRDRKKYRLLVVGEKKLPEMTGGGSKARKNWGFVEMVAGDPRKIEDELAEKTYETKTRGERERPAARSAGEGVYAVLRHGDHTHMIYALELPRKPGEVQEELDIEQEGSYILSIKNPEKPSPPRAGLRRSQKADYPEKLQEEFRGRRFIPADPPDFLDYEGAELLLIAASEDVSEEMGVTLDTEKESMETAETFRDLRMRRSEHPLEPLFQGEWA